MAPNIHDLGIDRWSLDDRLSLVHEIWDSIASEPGRAILTESQRQELDRRLAEHEANPTNVIPWEQVKAEALARLRK